MGNYFSFTFGELERALASLELMLDLKRGEFYRALSHYTCLESQRHEWELAKGVVCQLLACHTVENVNGMTKVLDVSMQWNIDNALRLRDRIQEKLPKVSTNNSYLPAVRIYLEDSDIFLLKESLSALSEVHNSCVHEVLHYIPFNHNKFYNEDGLLDWDITKVQAEKIIQQFTLPSSYDYAKLTFDLSSRIRGLWRFNG